VDNPQLKAKVVTLYIQEMARRGCHGYASFGLNAAQGDPELHQTTQAAREVFTLIAEGLHRHTIDHLLIAQPQQETFRRLVS
jgi:glutamate-1-semialdehyde 2,1-aminomutase